MSLPIQNVHLLRSSGGTTSIVVFVITPLPLVGTIRLRFFSESLNCVHSGEYVSWMSDGFPDATKDVQ